MKPGNLRKRGAKSGGKRKDEDSIFRTHRIFEVCGFYCSEQSGIFFASRPIFSRMPSHPCLEIHKVFLRPG